MPTATKKLFSQEKGEQCGNHNKSVGPSGGSLYEIQERTCLDCEDVEEDLIPKETGNCYICNDPLCKKCTESISRLLHLRNEEEQAETIGNKMLVAVCSTCRMLGLDKVHIAFKDFQTKDIGGNIRAFEKLKMFRDGSSKLPFIRQVVSKDPSQEALNTSMREHDKREEVYMSMVEEEGEDDTDSGEITIREGNLAEKVETLVEAIAGGELLIQDNRNLGEDPLAGTGARRKNQYQGQFQSQSLSEKLSEIIDIPTISIIYKSLLRFVSDEKRELGGVREEDERALRGCYDLLGLVSGRDPGEWFGHEEGLIASMILNDTDQDAINNSHMSDVTRNMTALAKHQGRGGRVQPMNSTGASMFGPGLETFIGAQGHMTDQEDDSGSNGEKADDEEEEEESIVQRTVATMESTMIQSTMDRSLPAQQPRLTDATVAKVKLREMENIKELNRQRILQRR